MASIEGLHHIGIRVTNAAVSEEFYNRLLGFEKTAEFSNGPVRLVFMQKGTCVIELIEKPEHARMGAGQTDHVALAVTGINEIVEMLEAAHVSFSSPVVNHADWIFGGVDNIFFEGPDGERIELFEVK